MQPLVLVDFSNYVYACWFPAVAANKADPKYDAYAVLKTNLSGKLGTLIRTLNDTNVTDFNIWFVEDRKSKRKYELYPEYKANRTPLETDPRPEAKKYLLEFGYNQFVHSPDNEADDTIATIVHGHRSRPMETGLADREIFVCSSDKDLWQLKDAHTHIWQLTKDKFVTTDMIEKEFGVSDPQHIPLCKALWGDSGDNVPNAVPRMQKQLLPLVREAHYGIEGLFEDLNLKKSQLSKRCIELIQLGEPQIRTNFQLVKLDTNCPIKVY